MDMYDAYPQRKKKENITSVLKYYAIKKALKKKQFAERKLMHKTFPKE